MVLIHYLNVCKFVVDIKATFTDNNTPSKLYMSVQIEFSDVYQAKKLHTKCQKCKKTVEFNLPKNHISNPRFHQAVGEHAFTYKLRDYCKN